MTRLTYKNIEGNLFTEQLLIGNQLGYVEINPKILEFWILTEKEVLCNGKANTLPALKKKAKATLKELGTNFNDELRNRGKTEKYKL